MSKESLYFRKGTLVAKSGEVRIYDFENELFLENGRLNLMSSSQKLGDYIWQISDKPFGNCLIVGLGLGIAAEYIESLAKAKNITVLEENIDIISVNKSMLGNKPTTFKVINKDYISFLYKSRYKYDFIFLDCYSKIDSTTIPYIADIVAASKVALKPKGILIGWLDNNTDERLVAPFFSLFNLD